MAVAPGLLHCKNLKRIYGIMGMVPVADGRYCLRENRHGAQSGEFPNAYRNEHRASFDPPLGGAPIFP